MADEIFNAPGDAFSAGCVGLHGKVADDFGITGVARLVVIDAEGKVVVPEGSYDDAKAAVLKLLEAAEKKG